MGSRWRAARGPHFRPAKAGRRCNQEMGTTTLRIGKCALCLGRSFVFVGVALALLCVPKAVGARELVAWAGDQQMGTIVIKTTERRLYYVLGNGMALRYDVAVGKEGMQWSGDTFVQSKSDSPSWTPTPRMRREHPSLPAYVPPGPNNPLGVRALYLGWTDYRIHGTNAPWSIGRAASSGCIRMRNADVIDLFERVHIGAPVHVIR